MPVGKGFIFASDNLEDIGTGTRKFLNQLKLYSREWKPKDHYVPTEPIGTFELEKEMGITINILKKFQKPYRFIKLVPTGFRKGPINFSRVKFHSKRAELMYFGVQGWELSEDE